MKAVGYTRDQLEKFGVLMSDINLPVVHPKGHDLLVEVKAVSVNPADYKFRERKEANSDEWIVLGFDGTGIVKEIGDKVTLFKPGDEVWYGGDITRQGSNEQFQLVDERIAGKKPKSLTFPQAAALPLTSLFSWEMVFDRMNIPLKSKDTPKTVLIIGAAGGVGSIMVQILHCLTDAIVIGTAGNDKSSEWLKQLGANYVINHNNSLASELKKIDFEYVDYIIGLNYTEEYLAQIYEIIAPEGHFGMSDPDFSVNIRDVAMKSITINTEVMFTRSMYKTDDMIRQHEILNDVAKLVDEGKIKTTVSNNLGVINADNIIKAYNLIKQHQTNGKIVLEGF